MIELEFDASGRGRREKGKFMHMSNGGQFFQLCFVVRDLDQAMRYFSATFGAGPWFLSSTPPQEVSRSVYRGRPVALEARIALAYGAGIMYELVCPDPGDQSVFSDRPGAGGWGLHHFGFSVEDFDATLRSLEEAGREPVFTSTTARGSRVAMVEEGEPLGALREFVEAIPESLRFYAFMKAQADGWDRSALVYTGPLPDGGLTSEPA